MTRARRKAPRCIVIARPNGAGKTTFAREFLPTGAGVTHFVNADLIASGLAPLSPEMAGIAAARILLKELDRLAKARTDFAFESTLSETKLCFSPQALEEGGISHRNCLPDVAFFEIGVAPYCSARAAGRAQCAESRRTSSLQAELGELPIAVPAAG